MKSLFLYVKNMSLKLWMSLLIVTSLLGCSLDADLQSLLKLDPKISVSLISPADSVSNASVIPVTIKLSEDVQDLTVDKIQVTNGTISNFSGNGSEYTFDITPIGDGAVVVTFPSTKLEVTDNTKKSTTSQTLVFSVDRVSPTVQLTTTASSPTNVAAIPVAVTFSESVTGLSISDFVVTGGGAAITSLTGSGSSYVVNVLATVSGSISIQLPASTVADAANNVNFASNTLTVIYDVNVPLPVLASTAPAVNHLSSIPVTVNFGTVSVFNLTDSDFTVINGTISGFTGTGSSYSLDLIPSGDGAVSIQLPAGVAENSLGTLNLASNTLTFNVDRVAPTLAIVGPTPAIGNSSTNFVWTVNYTGADNISLVTGGVTLGGTATAGCSAVVSGAGTTSRTVTVSGCTGNGDLNISIPANSAQDAAGNQALAAGPSSNATVDNTGPTLAIVGPTPAIGNSSTSFVWTVNYTGADNISLVTGGVTLGGTATAGCAAVVSGAGTTSRTVTVSGCTGNGDLNISIPANSAQDALGNQALAAGPSSNATVDNTAPTLVIGTASPLVGNSATTFSWPVTYTGADFITLNSADITLTGTSIAGCSAAITGSGTIIRTVEISGCSATSGTVGFSIAANSAHDQAGNQALAAGPSGLATIDNSNLTIVLASTASSATNLSLIPVTVTTSSSTSDFTVGDLTLVNATVTGFTGSGSSYSFNLIPSGDGAVSVQVPAGAAHDSVPNANLASNVLSFNVDRVAPTLAIVGPTPAIGNSSTNFVWTVNYTGADNISLVTGGVTLGGTATAGCSAVVSGAGTTSRTVTVSGCTGNGDLNISIPANSAQDAAGNQALAAGPSSNATVDNTGPTLAIVGPTPAIGNSSTSFVWTVNYTGADNISLVTGGVTLGGTATAGCAAVVSGAGTTSRTVTVSGCTGNGDLNISIPANSAQDALGNQALAAGPSSNATVDNTAPTLAIVGPTPVIGNSSTSFVWTVNYSGADSISLASGNISLGGTATAGCSAVVSGAGTTSRTVTVSGCTGNGDLNISIPANSAQDLAGNQAAAAGPSSNATVDNTGPTLAIVGPSPALGNSSTSFVWTLNYTDASVVSLVVGNITLTGTTAGCSVALTGSGLASRTVTVTNCSGTGNMGISVAANTAQDALGNPANSAVSTLATVDNTAPILLITGPTPTLGNSSTNFVWTVTYSGADTVTLADADISLGGTGTASCAKAVTGSGTTTRTVTVSGCTGNGNLNISVAANSAHDTLGNQALAAGPSGDATVDNAAPTLLITGPTPAIGNSSTSFVWTVNYTGADTVTLADADISLGGTGTAACAKAVTGSGNTTRTVTISGCTGSGDLNISVAANSAQDLVGNQAAAAGPSGNATLENTPPTLVIGAPNLTEGYMNDRLVWEITYSGADSVGLAVGHVTMNGGTTGCAVSVTGSGTTTRWVTLQGCTGHTNVGISINANSAQDSFGNQAAGAGPSGTVKLLNPVQVNFANVSDVIDKTAGVVGHQIPITLEKILPVAVSVNYKILNQTTAVNPTNYDFINGSVVIPAGQTTANITYNYQGSSSNSKIVQVALEPSLNNGYNLTAVKNIHRRLVRDLASQDAEYAQVSSGDSHTCGVTPSGALRCWGGNSSGQLGNGNNTSSNVPVTIASSGYSSVSAGLYHTCGVTTGGALRCWGYNSYGQLGNGNTTSSSTPVEIAASGYSSVSAGDSHTCGVTTGGALSCWGENSSGQLGNGNNTSSNVPVTIAASGYSSVSVGSNHTCGVTTGGALRCWGYNGYGQLGNGNNTSSNVPVTIAASGYSSVSAGYGHTCGITTGGALRCWGYNDKGQLGNGSYTNSNTPAEIAASGYSSVSAGLYHTCGITTGGALRCWGYNDKGQLGNGSYASSLTPVEIAASGYSSVSVGINHTCGVTTGGALRCWGYNDKGQLGNGYTTDFNTPVEIAASGYSSVSAGSNHTCGVTTGGALRCWGYNYYGQLGNGNNTSSNVPVTIAASGYSSVSVGSNHTCGVTTGGALRCWGNNFYGQLGNGDTTDFNTPVEIAASGYSSVSAGENHTCGVTTGGALRCWGYNGYGQLGNGDTTDSNTPVTIVAGGYSSVSAGSNHTCGVTTGGALRCWGYNFYGQLGNGNTTDSNTPEEIAASGYSSVSVGSNHTCGVTTGGALRCWGNNFSGQLGNGNTIDSNTPEEIAASGYSSVSAGSIHTCGVTTGGALRCWGNNFSGQLGNGNTINSNTPEEIAASGYSSVSVGSNHTCGVTTGGALRCWGYNGYGQLGNGSLWLLPAPVNP